MNLLEIFGAKESFELPGLIMRAALSDDFGAALKKIRAAGINDLRDFYQSDAGDRGRLKQDFTPDCVCDLVAKLMKPGEALDMCSGTGALSKAAVKVQGGSIFEQEYSSRTIPFAILDACLNGLNGTIQEADCLRDSLSRSYRISGEKVVEQIAEKPCPNVE